MGDTINKPRVELSDAATLVVRSAGIVHVFASKSISDHRAPRASQERVAVRIANSRHRL